MMIRLSSPGFVRRQQIHSDEEEKTNRRSNIHRIILESIAPRGIDPEWIVKHNRNSSMPPYSSSRNSSFRLLNNSNGQHSLLSVSLSVIVMMITACSQSNPYIYIYIYIYTLFDNVNCHSTCLTKF